MKHGDKAKKSAKSSKATSKKANRKVASASKAKSKSSSPQKNPKAAAPKASSPKPPAGGNGKSSARNNSGVIGFSNPIVAAAFKRAVKKYPTAFRRLTD